MGTEAEANYPYWSEKAETIFRRMDSNPIGLRTMQAKERLQRYGLNTLTAKKKSSVLDLFLSQFRSPIILILIFATLISAYLGEMVEAILIILIILGSSTLSFFQEYHANNASEALKQRVSITSSAARDGLANPVTSEEIVPGDIVLLTAGSLIPADGIIIESNELYVNQAVLTGESYPVMKSPGVVSTDASLAQRTNCAFMGTSVRSGTGKMLIVNTGKTTEFGLIAKSLSLREAETEFEKGVRQFGLMLSEIMLVMVVLVFGLNIYFQKPLIDSLLFSIALAVGLTPQLLPAIISINLSKGARVMAREGVIVKKLNVIENFGSMDILCTDKTGTLTHGDVKLDAAYDAEGEHSSEVQRLAYLNAIFQNGLQNPLDDAIRVKKKFSTSGYEKKGEIPYDFIRKRLSVQVETPDKDYLLVTKGALEKVLEICSLVEMHGQVEVLDEIARQSIRERFNQWSEDGNRVLAVAVKQRPAGQPLTLSDENALVFMGFLLFYDSPKKDAAATITRLEKMGICLKIITGDNERVTRHIARVIGLPITGVLTGTQMGKMADDALWNQVEKVNLFTEVDPNQKERIINALRKRKHIVGYMGDGINDAPSLHNADVGISVDQAVDVAKDAADFVLIRHDLAVLAKGVELGRTTFANTLKYIRVTISANFGNMFSMAGLSIFLPFLPLLPFQVLLLNFLTDFPALMIAGDAVDEDILKEPRKWDIQSIRRFMFTFGLVSSLFDYLTFILLLFVLRTPQVMFRTAWFMVSTFTELIAMLVLRTRHFFTKSQVGKGLLVSSALIALLAIMIPFMQPLHGFLGFEPLSTTTVVLLVGISASYALVNEVVKHSFYQNFKNHFRQDGKRP